MARVKSCLFVSMMFLFVCFAAQDDLVSLWRLWQGNAVMPVSDVAVERPVILRAENPVVIVNAVRIVQVSHRGAVVLFYEETGHRRERGTGISAGGVLRKYIFWSEESVTQERTLKRA